MVEQKEVIECVMHEPETFAGSIESLLRTDLLQTNDRNVLFAIKRNIELGMASEDILKRLLEIGNASPQLVALLMAFSIYRFYSKN